METNILTALVGSTAILLIFIAVIIYIWHLLKEQYKIVSEQTGRLAKEINSKIVCKKAVEDFINIFQFDYAVISLIDFKDRTISSRYYGVNKDIELGLADPENWHESSNYSSLTQNDILWKVIQTTRQVRVKGRRVLDKEKEITYDNLNLDIFDKYEHEKLTRIYIPIIHYQDIEKKTKIVLGVIELGFVNNIKTFFKLKKLNINRIFRFIEFFLNLPSPGGSNTNINELVDLQLYIDNFAQHYYRIFTLNYEQDLLKKLDVLENKAYSPEFTDFNIHGIKNSKCTFKEQFTFKKNLLTKESESNYLQQALNTLAELIKADSSVLIIFRLDNITINFDDKDTVFQYGLSKEDIQTVLNYYHINYVELLNAKEYFNNLKETNLVTGKNILLKNTNVCSELHIPILRKEQVIGVIITAGNKENYFDNIHIQIAERASKIISSTYIKKKRSDVVYKLLSLRFKYNKIEDIYLEIANNLKYYYLTEKILIWEKETYQNKELLESNTIDDNFKIFSLNRNEGNGLRIKSRYPFKSFEFIDNSNSSSKDYINEDLLNYETYVTIPIKVYGKLQAIIQIYSKYNINNSFKNDDHDFLKQITELCNLFIQHLWLVDSFKITSEIVSLKAPSRQDYEKFVESALKVTGATIVSFFPYDGKEILKRDGIFAGDFIDKIAFNNLNNDPAKLANIILIKGDTWLQNINEYENFIETVIDLNLIKDKSRLDFWVNNRIKSAAALKLEKDDYKIGILFFNFNVEQDFNEKSLIRLTIENFKRFAEGALINEKLLESLTESIFKLKEETDKLQIESRAYEQKNEILRLEREELQLQLEKSKNDLKINLDRITKMAIESNETNIKLIESQNRLDQIKGTLDEIAKESAKANLYMIIEAINHDVGNLLKGVSKTFENVMTEANLNNRSLEIIKRSDAFVKESLTTVNNLLELFEDSGFDESLEDINELISQFLRFFKNNNSKIEFYFKKDKNLKNLYCKKAEVSMIIYNLINNAVYFVNKRGYPPGKGYIKIDTIQKEDSCVIQIEDNGSGISNDNKERVYDFGYSSKPKGEGRGIGLYFIKNTITNLYSGNIEFTSMVNVGTTFQITLNDRSEQSSKRLKFK